MVALPVRQTVSTILRRKIPVLPLFRFIFSVILARGCYISHRLRSQETEMTQRCLMNAAAAAVAFAAAELMCLRSDTMASE